MPPLDKVPESHDPTHLMLVADTKMGKSTYAAECVLDGFTVIYVDSDNGISALRHRLKQAGKPEAMSRVMYFRTDHPCQFLDELLTKGIFRWNQTQDCTFSSGMAKPDDLMVEIIPSRIPRELIIVNDSWTSTALDAMEIGAADKKTTLETMADSNDAQGVYGKAGMKLTLLCAVIQHCRFNFINLAHPTVYEIYEKPIGRIADTKQKDMKLLDSIKVPLSCSRPHGNQMGKYFTDIGWIEVNRADVRELDFEVRYKRIGGGRPNRRDALDKMSFKALFGAPTAVSFDPFWIREYTATEWKAQQKPVATPAGVTAAGTIPSTPAKPTVESMMMKR